MKHPAFLSLAHWLAIFLLIVSSWSGLNLALDQRPWLLDLLPWWPGMRQVPFLHLLAALGWLTLLLLWLLTSGLARRGRQLSQLRQSGAPTGMPAATTLSAPTSLTKRHLNSVRPLRFVLLALMASGLLLYASPWAFVSDALRLLHLLLLLLLLPLLAWHLLTEWQIGGWPRVRHLFSGRFWRQPHASLQVLLAIIFTAAIGVVALHGWQSSNTLSVPKIQAEMRIDGKSDEAAWRSAPLVRLATFYGLPWARAVPVDIKMLHDGYTLYVYATWPDPTRSRQHLPLIKTAHGWQVQQSGLLQADETLFYEDKFALMIGDEAWAALRSISLGGPPQAEPQRVHDAQLPHALPPRSRGHHQMPKGEMVDVWHWKSVRNHGFGNLDDAFFGDGLPFVPGQRRYTWGYASDPLDAGGYKENWRWFDQDGVTPLRLPRKAEALAAFQSAPDKGNSNGKGNNNGGPVLALDWHDSQPWAAALDTYPVGTILPSVVWIHPNEGDRAHVRAAGVWRDGYWHLEMARSLDTGSRWDKVIHNGSFMWVATFDHSQTRHTWHLRPLRLQLEQQDHQ